MEAVVSALEAIYDFIVSLWDMLTKIVSWIGEVIALPGQALDSLAQFADFFPSYFWVPVIGIIGVLVIFRFLKIYKSGG